MSRFFVTSALSLFIAFAAACSSDSGDDEGTVSSDGAPGSDEGSAPSDGSPGGDEGSAPSGEAVIWSGPKVSFSKPSGGEFSDPQNQDKLTERVVLTRGNYNGLFNAFVESSWTTTSPTGTEWAEGTTANLTGLEFKPLKSAAGNQMSRVPGKTFVVHLIEEDIYLDVTFVEWQSGKAGGGFSYERSTPAE